MLFPFLLPWIVERHTYLGFGIDSSRAGGLTPIAEWTGQPEVFTIRSAVGGSRDDVLDLKRHCGKKLRGQAVATTMSGILSDL